MARMHGRNIRAYFGARDVSSDLVAITPTASVDTHDRTTFGDAGWHTFDAGMFGWEATLEAFYQTNSGGTVTSIERQFEAILGVAGGILSIYDGDADAVGDTGILLSDAMLTKFGQPVTISDLTKLSGTLTPIAGTTSTRMGLNAVLLNPLSAKSSTSQGTSVDNAASSANGGRGTLHVTAATGSGTIKIQHSADNSSFTDLITFTATSAATSETIEVTGTVNRYLRAQWTPGTSITFVVGFARY